jgi:hypothetical protein
MSKVLATINVDADFDYNLEEARLGDLYTEEAYVYFQRLQFKNLLARFEITIYPPIYKKMELHSVQMQLHFFVS